MYQNRDTLALSPGEHLAREWALFQAVDSGESDGFSTCWEADRSVVVVGRNSRASDHMIPDACTADGVEVLRRFSGGGAVVLGPGCLNYAVALTFDSHPRLVDVAASFRLLLDRLVAVLEIPGLSIDGQADIALDGRKVSGNAQRRGRRAMLHHGTLLYDFDPRMASRYLKEPVRQPAYRGGRTHAQFMGNLPLDSRTLRARLETAWAGLVIRRGGISGPPTDPVPT
jgi:lipoate---protein ligase